MRVERRARDECVLYHEQLDVWVRHWLRRGGFVRSRGNREHHEFALDLLDVRGL